jgi:HEAT repeat protein
LKDTDEHVRARSAIALGFLGDCRAVNPLIELLDQRDVSADMAAHALGRLGDVRAVEPLLRVLSPTNAYNHLQVPAIDALVQLKAVHATELLIPLLADRHIDIAKRAATALAELGEPKWEKYVKGDKDDIERLGNCQDERIVAPLISALGSRYRERRNESARALAKLGQPQWLDLLTLRQDEYYRQLSGFGEIVVGAMLTALQEGDRKTRLTAVQALIQIAEKHPCYRDRITQFRHDVARPHEDRSVGSSDCTHVDQGLGIQLPF